MKNKPASEFMQLPDVDVFYAAVRANTTVRPIEQILESALKTSPLFKKYAARNGQRTSVHLKKEIRDYDASVMTPSYKDMADTLLAFNYRLTKAELYALRAHLGI